MKNVVWTEESSKINSKTWQEIIDITEKITCQEIIDTMANLSHIPNKRTKSVFCAISCLGEIYRFKKNIKVMCWQDYQKNKELFILAMKILKVRREFIIYKYCIRNKTTGGKIFFKIINNGNCAKFEFKSFGKGENNVGKQKC
jgi:hypothetical protein